MDVKSVSLLMFVAALMAAAFLFIRIAGPALGPVFLIDVRVALAAAVLLVWARLKEQPLEFRRPWKDWAALGLFNAAGPFTLIAWAELHITSSLAAILIATIPLFTALVSAVWLNEPLTPKKGVGLGLGLVGVTVLSGWSPQHTGAVTALAVTAVLVAACSYAVGGVYARRRFRGVSSLSVATGNFAAAALLLLPWAAFSVPTALPPVGTVLALLALVLLSTVTSFLLYFRLIERHGALTASSIGYLIPVFGALYGAAFLREPLSAAAAVGLGVVLLSVGLVTNLDLGLVARAQNKGSTRSDVAP